MENRIKECQLELFRRLTGRRYSISRRASGSHETLRWREMDSNFWYRGTEAVDFRSIPGIAGDRRGSINGTT